MIAKKAKRTDKNVNSPLAEANVYILVHRDAGLVKIGKAIDIISRASNLGLGEFNLDKSIGFRVADESTAFKFERLLHLVFSQHRISPEKAANFVKHSGGLTEWFSAQCLHRAITFLEHIKDIIQFDRVNVRLLNKPQAKLKKLKPTKQKTQDMLEAERRDANALTDENKTKFNLALDKLMEVVDFVDIEVRETEAGNCDMYLNKKCSEEACRLISDLLFDLICYGRVYLKNLGDLNKLIFKSVFNWNHETIYFVLSVNSSEFDHLGLDSFSPKFRALFKSLS